MGYKFVDEKHKDAFLRLLAAVRYPDGEHAALLYLLTATETTRTHFSELYNVDDDSIYPDSLAAPWQTGTSLKIVRLSYNLWNGLADDFSSEVVTDKDGYSYAAPSEMFTPLELFSCELMPFMLQAVQMRFYGY